MSADVGGGTAVADADDADAAAVATAAGAAAEAAAEAEAEAAGNSSEDGELSADGGDTFDFEDAYSEYGSTEEEEENNSIPPADLEAIQAENARLWALHAYALAASHVQG